MNYERILAENAKQLKPSGIRKFFDVAATIPGAISLGVGEPDFPTPWSVRDAAIKSIQKGITQYTSNGGLPELRKKIAEYMEERFSLSYEPLSEVIVTVGASEGIDITLRALLNPGDEVLIAEPCFVSYAPCVRLCNGVPVPVSCDFEHSFKLLPEAIEAAVTPRTKAILFNYPSNPTGAVMSEEELVAVAKVIKKYNLIALSDEIYSELTYSGKHVSIASLPGMQERTVVLNGFSKAFSMTGWRIGFLCAPKELAGVILKIHQYVIMCAPTPSQYAALAALTEGLEDGFSVVEEMRNEYDKRRRFVYESLKSMGLETFEPLGAFYIFPQVSALGLDGDGFAEELLAAQAVAVVPGSAFGTFGKDNVRISYAYSMRDLDRAIERIQKFISAR